MHSRSLSFQRLIRDCIGQDLTLIELNAATARITTHYRQHGYLLSRAYLPAQDIREGEVEVAVLEGRLADVHVANTSHVAASLVSQHVKHIDTAAPVQGPALERSLLLLNNLPGVEVRSTLRPGATVGTADLDLQVRGVQRLNGSVDADSYGNRYTGEFRGGGTLNVNSPLHRGDLFTLRASTAGSGMTYGRAAWQTPLGGNGFRAGIAWSDLHYELGKEFDPRVTERSRARPRSTVWTPSHRPHERDRPDRLHRCCPTGAAFHAFRAGGHARSR